MDAGLEGRAHLGHQLRPKLGVAQNLVQHEGGEPADVPDARADAVGGVTDHFVVCEQGAGGIANAGQRIHERRRAFERPLGASFLHQRGDRRIRAAVRRPVPGRPQDDRWVNAGRHVHQVVGHQQAITEGDRLRAEQRAVLRESHRLHRAHHSEGSVLRPASRLPAHGLHDRWHEWRGHLA
jgi:hypothetical protein